MKKQIRIYIYIIGLILIDQLSKVWALSALRGTEGIAVIPNVFELSYLENRGAAFGILQDHQIFFVLITVAAAVILHGSIGEYHRRRNIYHFVSVMH